MATTLATLPQMLDQARPSIEKALALAERIDGPTVTTVKRPIRFGIVFNSGDGVVFFIEIGRIAQPPIDTGGVSVPTSVGG